MITTPLEIMIDLEGKEKMQAIGEASIGCLRPNGPLQFNSQDKAGSTIEALHLPNNDKKMENQINTVRPEKLIWDTIPPPNQGYSRPFYQQDFFPPYFLPDYPIGHYFYQPGQDYYYPFDNRVQYHLPHKLFSQGVPQLDPNFQEFQYFVVIDFEATCDKDRNPHPQEIIEFPSVLVNSATGQLEASFQTYVRPTYNQHLTEFCKELTGIQQIQVDRGVPLSEALLMHDKWLEDKGIKHKNFAVVTWSNWDCRIMLESECKFKHIRKPPYFNRWINLKVPFMEVFGGIRCNLKEAVQLAGLVWEGRAHCGLDDARNTARLLALLMHRGFKFSITNSMCHPDSTTPPKPKDPPLQVGPPFQSYNYQYLTADPSKDAVGPMYCHCGVLSSKNWVRRPGPTQGRCFFGCGQWTATRRAVCNYFMWATP
ncbi:hypothetical protein LUZ63_010053 [Rhynchospora breviuscula]|uniref:GRF-type domain-containing protein n=1 Tax=Rhynchospora breviuscula TaxID=2022672 RepID=A0A9Q0CGD1_9POAL|nr:hypothetical protein LUZ63_010053 [Rhynchospora breviuscula]